MRILFAAAAAVFLLSPSVAARLEDSPDPVALRASAVRDRFDAAIRACGVTPSYLASVVVNSPPDGIAYGNDQHAVNISRWEKLAPQVQAAMQAWPSRGRRWCCRSKRPTAIPAIRFLR